MSRASRSRALARALAPAKVNLGLFLGPVRPQDGRHELVTVMQSLSLCDEVRVGPARAGAEGDELRCEGVPGPPQENLAARALERFRSATGWSGPPLEIELEKRIPVAAGLAGGSADAAAVLRAAQLLSGAGDERLLMSLAAGLGADVPAQLRPGRWLAQGAGERLSQLPEPEPRALGVLLLPSDGQLSTAAVYAQADRLGLGRPLEEISARAGALASELAGGAPLPASRELLANDLQAAAISLMPAIGEELSAAWLLGCEHALVCGSGPTVAALFCGEDAWERLDRAAAALAGRTPAAVACHPVGAEHARAALLEMGRR